MSGQRIPTRLERTCWRTHRAHDCRATLHDSIGVPSRPMNGSSATWLESFLVGLPRRVAGQAVRSSSASVPCGTLASQPARLSQPRRSRGCLRQEAAGAPQAAGRTAAPSPRFPLAKRGAPSASCRSDWVPMNKVNPPSASTPLPGRKSEQSPLDIPLDGAAAYRIVVQGVIAPEWSRRLAGLAISTTESAGSRQDNGEHAPNIHTIITDQVRSPDITRSYNQKLCTEVS